MQCISTDRKNLPLVMGGYSLSKKSSPTAGLFSHICSNIEIKAVKSMLRQEIENRSQMEFFCVDEFVPQDHLLRKIDKAVDFSRIYDLVEKLYCPDNGRPSCDPVLLFKMGQA